MRSKCKLFSTLLAVIFIVAAFSIPVSADRTVVASGTVKSYYDYVLYSDGELNLKPVSHSTTFHVKMLENDLLKDIKSVTVDLGDEKDVYYETININGGNCPAVKLSILCSSARKKISNIHICEFPDLKGENIVFSQGLKLGYLEITRMGGLTDLSFLNRFPETESVLISQCNNLKKELVVNCQNIDEFSIQSDSTMLDFSRSSCKTVSVGACHYLTDVYFPEGCKDVYVGGNYLLKTVFIPESVESVYYSCFSSCNSLSDIYFYGSKTQFDSIKTYSYNEDYEHEYNGTISSIITGSRIVHYLNGIKQGWVQDNYGIWYYLDSKSRPVTGWKQISGSWYHFSDYGYMHKNWLDIGNDVYYLGDSGAMKTGWQSIDGKWYYFENSGALVSEGWKSIGGKWYFFDFGFMQSSQWIEDNGKWYYLKSDGSMASYEYINGYWLNKDGSWTYKHKAEWHKDSKGWWYGDDTGWYAKNATYTIDGKSYTFDSHGYIK